MRLGEKAIALMDLGATQEEIRRPAPNGLESFQSDGISKFWFRVVPILLGLVLFLANNLPELSPVINPRVGYVPLFTLRNEDSGQYLVWLEGFKGHWTVPDYHAPWKTEPALNVPFFWLVANAAALIHIRAIYLYMAAGAACYVLAFYSLFALLNVFTHGARQKALAVALMLCSVPLRTYGLLPALLLKGKEWALLHCGYGTMTSEGLLQGISASPIGTFATATAILCVFLLGQYFSEGRRQQLWIGTGALAASAFLHPYEFIPISGAAIVAIIWTERRWRKTVMELAIFTVPQLAVVLFYAIRTLRNSLKFA